MRFLSACFLLLLICQFGYSGIKKNAEVKSVPAQVDSAILRAKSFMLKRPDMARVIAERALVMAKKISYRRGIGVSFNLIGVSYWAQSSLPVSQFYLQLALPYLKGDNKALSDCYRNMARNYVDMKDYKLGLHYFKASLKRAGKDTALRAVAFTELTTLFNATNDYQNGVDHIAVAFKYSRKTKRNDLVAILYERLGQLYVNKGVIDSAEHNLDSCYGIAIKLKNKRLLSVLMIDRARLFMLKNNLAQAIPNANNGYALADTIGSPELKLRALKVLASIYRKQDKLAMAIQLQDQSIAIYDSVKRFSNSKTLQLIKDYADLNNKLNQIEQADLSNNANRVLLKSKNKTIALLIVSLITAISLLLIIYIYYRQKNQLNTRLQTQHRVLTDQKQVIEVQRTDLEEVNKLKDKLLAIIGHDLRTPIANMSSITDLFAQDYITPDEVKKLMQDLTPVIKGAELTLSNLMDFASGQIKGQTVTASNVNMFLVAAEIKATFEHQLNQKNITFINKVEPVISVWADSNHVKVIVRNLVSNAIKFTSNNGQITVSAETEGTLVYICVQDTGVGMSAENVERLFKTNHHFSQSGTQGEKGTGLGLLLCKELIELNKGKLWVETNPGEGCRFYFSLPATGAEA